MLLPVTMVTDFYRDNSGSIPVNRAFTSVISVTSQFIQLYVSWIAGNCGRVFHLKLLHQRFKSIHYSCSLFPCTWVLLFHAGLCMWLWVQRRSRPIYPRCCTKRFSKIPEVISDSVIDSFYQFASTWLVTAKLITVTPKIDVFKTSTRGVEDTVLLNCSARCVFRLHNIYQWSSNQK